MEGKNRKSIRLPGYDYSSSGFYFITVCTYNRKCLFGNIVDNKIYLSEMGIIVDQCWNEIPKHYPLARLNEYIIMPNHIHGVIEIIDNIAYHPAGAMPVGAENFLPLQDNKWQINKFQQSIPRSLSGIVRGFKIGVTKWCRQNKHNYVVWQRNYYEHIIQNEPELNRIREYIAINPANWGTDRNNLKSI